MAQGDNFSGLRRAIFLQLSSERKLMDATGRRGTGRKLFWVGGGAIKRFSEGRCGGLPELSPKGRGGRFVNNRGGSF